MTIEQELDECREIMRKYTAHLPHTDKLIASVMATDISAMLVKNSRSLAALGEDRAEAIICAALAIVLDQLQVTAKNRKAAE